MKLKRAPPFVSREAHEPSRRRAGVDRVDDDHPPGISDMRKQQQAGCPALHQLDAILQLVPLPQRSHHVDPQAVVGQDDVPEADHDGVASAGHHSAGSSPTSSRLALEPVTMLDSSPLCSSMSNSAAE